MESWTNNTPKKNAGNLKTKAMDSGPALHPRSPVGSIRDNLKPQPWYAKHFSPKLNRWQVAKLASKIFRLAEGMQAAICQRKRQWFLMRNWNVSSTYFGGFGNTVTWTSGGITASHTQMASSSCVPSSCNCRDAGIKLVVGLDTHTNNRPGSSWHDIWKAPFMWPSEGGWFSILSSCCGNDWLERPKFVHDVRCTKWIHAEQYWHRPRWSWCYHLGCCLHPTAIIMPRLSTLFSGHFPRYSTNLATIKTQGSKSGFCQNAIVSGTRPNMGSQAGHSVCGCERSSERSNAATPP